MSYEIIDICFEILKNFPLSVFYLPLIILAKVIVSRLDILVLVFMPLCVVLKTKILFPRTRIHLLPLEDVDVGGETFIVETTQAVHRFYLDKQ